MAMRATGVVTRAASFALGNSLSDRLERPPLCSPIPNAIAQIFSREPGAEDSPQRDVVGGRSLPIAPARRDVLALEVAAARCSHPAGPVAQVGVRGRAGVVLPDRGGILSDG